MNRYLRRLFFCLTLTAAAWNANGASAADDAEQKLLTIGSNAPELNIEHWLSTGNGAFKKVTKFEAGKVYVVEFWATWCGPCIQSMPHLSKLQQDYASRGVQIVSVSDEDVEAIKEFLAREIPRAPNADSKKGEPKTYAELTSAWCLTTDPDGSVMTDYMQAARQSGIPTAFIVGKKGEIEWIGHPAEIDEPLEQVVAGKWDRETFRAEFQAKQEAELAMETLRQALAERKFDKAITLIDERVGKVEQPQERFQLQMTKLQILMVQDKADDAAKHLAKCFEDAKEDINLLDAICWHIYEQSEQRRKDITPLLKVAKERAQKALATAKGETKGSLLDTTAHIVYRLGELDEAIELAKQAVASSSDQNKQFSQQFLEQLQNEKAEANKPAEKKTEPKK
ncbi:MAG: TlpA disulfide reductase family protein [Pirellulales bacterium]